MCLRASLRLMRISQIFTIDSRLTGAVLVPTKSGNVIHCNVSFDKAVSQGPHPDYLVGVWTIVDRFMTIPSILELCVVSKNLQNALASFLPPNFEVALQNTCRFGLEERGIAPEEGDSACPRSCW